MRNVGWVMAPSTWWEVFGLVVSEAWMLGRPVIASAIGGFKERIADGVNGLTFPARDARALAETIVSVEGNEAKWVKTNAAIDRPWSDVKMVAAHKSLWSEANLKLPALREANPSSAWVASPRLSK